LTAVLVCLPGSTLAQRGNAGAAPSARTRATRVASNAPPPATAAQSARIDLIESVLEGRNRPAAQKMVKEGLVSVLDLEAPPDAVKEYVKATDSMRHRKSQEAEKHLAKAITLYPGFVSAHNDLGVVYFSLGDMDLADEEFQAGIKLDPKFPGSYANAGNTAFARHDYSSAESDLQKAADLSPGNVKMLALLVIAENGNGDYAKAIDTTARIHMMEHKQFANAHYVAAAAAISIKDFPTAQRQLAMFVQEDPKNPLASAARNSLDELAHQPPPNTTDIANNPK